MSPLWFITLTITFTMSCLYRCWDLSSIFQNNVLNLVVTCSESWICSSVHSCMLPFMLINKKRFQHFHSVKVQSRRNWNQVVHNCIDYSFHQFWMLEDFMKVFTQECEDKKVVVVFSVMYLKAVVCFVFFKHIYMWWWSYFLCFSINVCVLYECTVQCVPHFVKWWLYSLSYI